MWNLGIRKVLSEGTREGPDGRSLRFICRKVYDELFEGVNVFIWSLPARLSIPVNKGL